MTGYNIYRTDGIAPIICCRKIWYIKIKSFARYIYTRLFATNR